MSEPDANGPGLGEMAQAGLEVYAAELSPHYQNLRERLVGEAATQGWRLAAMQHAAQTAETCGQIVLGLVDTLPAIERQEEDGKHQITANDAFTARAVQAHVLWHSPEVRSGDASLEQEPAPYYIVGERDHPGERPTRKGQTEVLLANGDGVVSRGVRTKEFRAARHFTARNMGKEYSQDELTDLFDPRSGGLRVKQHTVGNMAFRSYRTATEILGPGSIGFPSAILSARRQVNKRSGQQAADSLFIRRRDSYYNPATPQDTITLEDMGSFDVFHHLSGLATVFGQVPVLGRLLERLNANPNPS